MKAGIMIKELMAGGLWVFTVSVGAWAYIEGKRIDNGQETRKDEAKDDIEIEDEVEIENEVEEEYDDIEPQPLPLGKVPWVMRDRSGRIVARNDG